MTTNEQRFSARPGPTAGAVVRELRGQNEDHEWYPSTAAMLEVIRADIRGLGK